MYIGDQLIELDNDDDETKNNKQDENDVNECLFG